MFSANLQRYCLTKVVKIHIATQQYGENRHFEIFELSQLSNGKHVLLCTNMSGKSIAEYCKIRIKSIA